MTADRIIDSPLLLKRRWDYAACAHGLQIFGAPMTG